ncbi:MAG: DMT family transporter, partial [Cyanobacteria bacterium REEB67]|nr:DMT family transporter [Cyanobacteria bacterium REEB67]
GQSFDRQIFAAEIRRPLLTVLMTRSILGAALIVTGFTLTTAIKSVLLLRVEALFVFAWSVFFRREKATAAKLLLLVALSLGAALVVTPAPQAGGVSVSFASGINLGDILIVCSLLLFSYSYIPTEKIVARVSPTTLNIVSNAVGGVVILLVALLLTPVAALNISAQAWLLINAYALCFGVIGINLYFFAFKTHKPWIIAAFLSLEVVYGVPLAWLMRGEIITPLQGGGALIVVAATVCIGLLDARTRPQAELEN